jgi:hypothetical protein
MSMALQPHSPAEPKADSAALWPAPSVRRWICLAYAVAWTIALLVPMPIHAPRETALGEGLFTFSKSLHVLAYSLFTFLVAWMRLPRLPRALLLAGLFGHAMLTEFLQWLLEDITHRTGQWSDVRLDSIGIVLGVVLAWKLWRA